MVLGHLGATFQLGAVMSDLATPVMGPQDCLRSEQLSLQPLRPPTHVPGYEPERFLGRGAYGEVWVAVDCNSGRRVAIKFYSHRGSQDWSFLSREVEKLGLFFNDRYVVQLFKVGWDADPPYYVMEYLENGSLDEELQGPLPVERAVTLFREIATGLMHAHNRGVLHCDLKPANILLDADHRPRLADFGQARLMHEHAPTLGTLFYMAPEQADLKAVPDARWDVYSLGVLLYRMLTGELPYHTDAAVTDLGRAQVLEQRLETYRRLLCESPRPGAHRHVPDIDRPLVQIIDRCLAIEPKHRFANVQAVLSALDARAFQRARRPLVLLGALGPALLLGGMILFAWAMIVMAVNETKEETIDKVQESNHLVARFAANRLAERIKMRWSILEEEAASPRFQELVQAVRTLPPTPEAAPAQPTPAQKQLQEWLHQRRRQYNYLHIDDFWLVLDDSGRLLEVSANPGSERWRQGVIGRFFWHRDGFHGMGVDLDPPLPGQTRPANVVPIKRPHQSLVFRSTEDRHPLIVLFSVPVINGSGLTIAVLGMAVHLGHFSEVWWTTSDDTGPGADLRWVTLVQTKEQKLPPDTEKGRLRNVGLILEHPVLRAAQEGEVADTPIVYLETSIWSELKEKGATTDYRDPFKAQTTGTESNRYLAAAEPVRLKRLDPDTEKDHPASEDTGWLVVVQDDYTTELAPAVELEWKLLWWTLLALGVAAALVTALWLVVSRGLIDAPRSRLAAFMRRRSGLTARTTLATGSPPRSAATSSASGTGSNSRGVEQN
jgi:serine/threonine protein kinase